MGEAGYRKFKAKLTEMCFENQLAETLKTAIGGGNITLVNYWGRKYGSEKDVLWKDADIFAFPTFYDNETFGLVNLEAMEYALPVVSTNEGGIPDVVINGQTGYTVDKNNPEALADALERLFRNPELGILMGKAGRKRFEEMFTEETFERNIRECLKRSME